MTKSITVNLRRQVLIAYENGKRVFAFDCVTGDSSHPTGPGRFKVFRKEQSYVSHTYHVPMDFALFFTPDGKAVHKSHMVGPVSILKSLGADSLGSHGCVRLSDGDARKLFDWAPIGTTVEVNRGNGPEQA